MNRDIHPQAGKTIKVYPKQNFQLLQNEAEFVLEDWWVNVAGQSWMSSNGNPAAIGYAMRSASVLPYDDEVVYGKVNHLGYLVHISELGEIVEE